MLATLRREVLGLYMNKAVSIIITILIILFLGLLLVSNIVKSAWVQLQFYVVEDDSYDTDIDENVYTLKLWSVIKTLWNGDSYYLAIIVFFLCLLFTYIKMFFVLLSLWMPMHWTPRAKMLSILAQVCFISIFVFLLTVLYFFCLSFLLLAIVFVTLVQG